VEFDSPIYRAPSVPKISRRNISSPIIRGAQSVSAPKLKTTKFSFIKPRIQTPTLTSETTNLTESSTLSENKVYETLVETNRILVEIQKQLALDFATRIVERKDKIRDKKIRAEKDKISKKEQSIESVNKLSERIGGFFDKVTAPAKSIFQKLLDFFGIIVTGLVVNNAFNWLSDDKNRKTLENVLNSIGKYWKEIVGVLIGLKVVSTIVKLYTTLKLVGAILLSPLFLKTLALIIAAAGVISLAKVIEPVTRERVKQAAEAQQGKSLFVPGTGGIGDPYSGLERQLYGSPTATPGDFDFNKGIQKSKGGTIPNLPSYNFKTSIVKQYQNITQKFSEGGTVGGAGSGLVDSVRTMLAPGEEVIRTSAAMMFRPLLKDINNNAGRMWTTFSNSIRDMVSYNETMRYALDELSRNLETFKKQLDDFVNQEKLEKSKKAGGGGYGLRTPSKDSITTLVLPTTIIHSDLKKPTRPATRTTIPITLPTKTANYKMPAIDGGMATDEPDISSVNLANDYMMLTPKMYGIFV
jgi:hypothetical protein